MSLEYEFHFLNKIAKKKNVFMMVYFVEMHLYIIYIAEGLQMI